MIRLSIREGLSLFEVERLFSIMFLRGVSILNDCAVGPRRCVTAEQMPDVSVLPRAIHVPPSVEIFLDWWL
jgi:hypothetical protein